MIEYLNGELAELSPTLAVIDVGGVGYGLNISLTTFDALKDSKKAKLYVYESIREDAYILYGFATKTGAGFVAFNSVQELAAILREPYFRHFRPTNSAWSLQMKTRVP